MQLKEFYAFSCALLCILAVTVDAREKADQRNYIVGMASVNIQNKEIIDGFKAGLSERGYIEGKNVIYLYKGVQDISEIDGTLKEFRVKGVDLMFTMTTPVTKKAAQIFSGTGMPVIFAGVYDPVSAGLVESISHPGRNITGIQVGGNTAKSLEWMATAFPGAKRILVPVHRDTQATAKSLEELSEAAKKLKIELVFSDIASAGDLIRVLNTIPGNISGIFITNSILFSGNIEEFVRAAKKMKLPLGGSIGVSTGVHISFSHLRSSTGKQAARLASQILGGEKASEIPVEVSEYYLCVNLRSLREAGLTISDEILQQADEIFRE